LQAATVCALTLGKGLAPLTETLLSLLFVLTSVRRPWNGWRALPLLLFAVLMVATRTDAVLLIAFLMLLEWMLEPRHRPVALLVFLSALTTYFVIQKSSGNYGYIAHLNFSLVDRTHEPVPNLALNLHGYLLAFVHQVLQTLGEDPRYALFFLAVRLLAFAWFRERRMCTRGDADEFNQRALILTAALPVYLLVRVALFPFPLSRFLMNAYIVRGAVRPCGSATTGLGIWQTVTYRNQRRARFRREDSSLTHFGQGAVVHGWPPIQSVSYA
jgi:hypothetical protein